jgi:hypothetical protein
MKDISDLFWTCSMDELELGIATRLESKERVCLVCGMTFEPGRVYPSGEAFFDQARAASEHIETEHGGIYSFLLSLDKRLTGLTEHQRELARMFKEGKTDAAIAHGLGGLSASTVRNHRFAFREKAKQARIFLAIAELMERAAPAASEFVAVHRNATMVDERYAVTKAEDEEIASTYFDGDALKRFPRKEKHKLPILRRIAALFEPGRKYTEKEVSDAIRPVFRDYATIRRYLIEYGFMDREEGGGEYWLKV